MWFLLLFFIPMLSNCAHTTRIPAVEQTGDCNRNSKIVLVPTIVSVDEKLDTFPSSLHQDITPSQALPNQKDNSQDLPHSNN